MSLAMCEQHKQKTRRITLSTVASKAGVSLSTASLVLSGKARQRRISEDVHERVEQAARDLDYIPNMLVHSMQSGSTGVISFFNGYRSRSVNDLYMDQLSTAIERAAGVKGYDILVHCDFNRTIEQIYRSLNGGRSDGLLFFAPSSNDELLDMLRHSRLPTVLLGSKDQTGTLSSVTDSMKQGLTLIANKLIERRHSRVLMLGQSSAHNDDSINRIQALSSILREAGIASEPQDTFFVNELDLPDFVVKLQSMLTEPNPPTAIFCWHDLLGYRLLDLCDQYGIDVPNQIAIAGYDGLHWPSRSSHLLTSAHFDLDVMASSSIEILIKTIRHEITSPSQLEIPSTLLQGTTL